MRIGVDLDGVLFDFNTQFIEFCNKNYGTSIPPVSDQFPDTWNYHYQYGLKEKNNEIWERIHSNPAWWAFTPEYPWTRDVLSHLHGLDYNGHEVFFITSRSGKSVKWASTRALELAGYANACVIPVASPDKKIPVIQALGIKIFVDDKPETVNAVHTQCRKTISMVFDQPWNRDHAKYNIPRGVLRVAGDTMIHTLKGIINANDRREKL